MFKLGLIFFIAVISFEKFNCGEVNLLNAFNVRWQNEGEQTAFWVTANLPTSVVNDTGKAWIGVGINDVDEMHNLNTVICESSGASSSLYHYTAIGMEPELFSKSEPILALSSAKIEVVPNGSGGTNITCSFRRQNTKPNALELANGTRYLEITPSTRYYIMVAFREGKFGYHRTNRALTDSPQTFETSETQTPTTQASQNDLIALILQIINAIFAMFFKS